jgi:hypothetical protein
VKESELQRIMYKSKQSELQRIMYKSKQSELQWIMYKGEREWITKNHVQRWKWENCNESCARVNKSKLQRIMYKGERKWITKNHIQGWKRVNYKESCTRVKECELLSESEWHSWLFLTIPSPHTLLQLHTSPFPPSPTTNVSIRCFCTKRLHNEFVPWPALLIFKNRASYI